MAAKNLGAFPNELGRDRFTGSLAFLQRSSFRGSAYSGALGRPRAFEDIFEVGTNETINPGKALFWDGAPANHIFMIVDGVARVCRFSPDGRRTIARFAFPGDVLGLFAKGVFLFTAEAVTAVRVRRYPRERLLRMMADAPELALGVIDHMRDELCAVQEQSLLLMTQGAEERIVKFLLHMAGRCPGLVGSAREFALPMSRTDIADHVGLTMETVCRTFTKLRKRGLVELRGPHRVRIPNVQALRTVLSAASESHDRAT